MIKLKDLYKKLRRYGFNSYGAFRVGIVYRMIRSPFVTLKKHYFKSCNGKLEVIWITQFIYEGTPEAKGKDLLYGFSGKPVQYSFAIFACSKCGNQLSINDQYFLENPRKLEKYNMKHGYYRLGDDYHIYKNSQDNIERI